MNTKRIGILAAKTFLQSILGVWTAGMLITDIDWKFTLTVAISAAVYSILTNVLLALDEYTKGSGDKNGTTKKGNKKKIS